MNLLMEFLFLQFKINMIIFPFRHF